ncbi:MAG: PEP-CTERM sorting domain-containing protein, partial [Betaproteobacteria bacterium]|nr:PEP-CTERM sorting domain-containing protein [Betaproteobacteria bacterium]
GNSGDPVTLLAVYVDARDYFINNANPIKFNYGVYGPLTDAAGSNTATIDFANLTIPEPSSASLMVVGLGVLFRRSRKRV